MSKRYYHKVINPSMYSIEKALETDANYELVRVVPVSQWQIVLVFVEHVEEFVEPADYPLEITDPQPTTEEQV